MRTFKQFLTIVFLGMCAGILTPIETSASESNAQRLCQKHGTIAFVQQRNAADIAIRFVASGEDARISFHRNRMFIPGMWRVVAKTENPDYTVFVDSYVRNDTVDVRIVDYNPGCRI